MPSMRSLPLLLLAACASPPPPWQAPQAALQVAEIADLDATAAAAGRAVTVALHAMPTTPAGEAIAADVLLVAAERQHPFRGAAPTAGWLRLPAGPLPADSEPVASADHVVRTATTCRWHGDLAGLPAVELRRRDDGSLGLAFRVPGADGAALHVHLQSPLTARTVFFVPAPAGNAGGLLVEIVPGAEVQPPTVANPVAPDAAPAASPAPPPTLRAAQLDLVARSIGAQNRRGALLAMVLRSGDAALVDALVTAEEAVLIDASRRVAALPKPAAPNADAEADPDWPLAVAIWTAFADAAQRDQLSPGTRACLLRHFGSLALDPFGLGEALAGSRDAAAFWAAVRADNQNSLGDLTVHGRVHGHDWLAARQLAVPDYDPLADEPARQDALRAASPTEVRR